MRASEAMIFWNHKDIKIIRLYSSDVISWYDYPYSGGACWVQWREDCENKEKAIKILKKELKRIIREYKIDKQVAENAFLEIDEYKESCQK